MVPHDFVLEIGPGIGTMTQYLAEAAREVTAVEIDRNLIPILDDTLSAYSNVTVINEDILKVDIAALAREKNGGKPIKVVANLPYYITTPIIMDCLRVTCRFLPSLSWSRKKWRTGCRPVPVPRTTARSSLAVQYYAKPYIAANVPPNCFIPRPAVGSAVIRLTRHEKPPVDVRDPKFMFRLIRASFNQRRKTLQNGLHNAADLQIPKEKVVKALEEMGLPASVRGEKLDLKAVWPRLADLLGES